MGTFLIYCSWSYLRFAHSDVATKSDESHESHEGSERCQGRKGHDGNSRLQVRGRIHWFESEGRKGNYGGLGGRGSRSVEKDWLLQDCRCAELEAQVETCDACAQGRQPIHERALRLQSQASIQDCEGTSDEKAESLGELMVCALCGNCKEVRLELFRSRWAVSPGLGDALYLE